MTSFSTLPADNDFDEYALATEYNFSVDSSNKAIHLSENPETSGNKEYFFSTSFITVPWFFVCTTAASSSSRYVAKATEKGKSAFAGHEIKGKTLAVIGLGAIGKLVAESALFLGMKVVGYDPYVTEKVKKEFEGKAEICGFDEAIERADIITLHVPFNANTKNMINAEAISKMKKGAIIINMARGELVDAEAVKEALHEGKIGEYVVDFPDENTINSERIIVIPHLGASTEEAEDNCAVMAGKELMEYIENGNITNSVNYPGVNKARTGKVRTCILFNAADKDDVEKIAGDKEVAVKGDYGYAVFDGDAAVKFDKAIRIRTIA